MKYLRSNRAWAAICVFLLWSCALPQAEAERVEFLDGGFSVEMPAGWSLQKDLNDEADLQMGLPFIEAYAIVLSESKEDFDDSVDLDEHSRLTYGILMESLSNGEVSATERLEVNGVPAVKHTITGSFDHTKVIYWHVTFETEEHYHQMLLWSLPSKFKKLKDSYSEVIQSFRVE